jgi:hypothetical protein
MDNDLSRIKASLQLFDNLECCSTSLNGNFDDMDTALALVDLDKMRCHVINCLTAMHLIEIEKKIKKGFVINYDYELVKSKVFHAANSMIVDEKFGSNEAVVKSILSGFPNPDEGIAFKEQSWLPIHFAIALGVRKKISEDDIRIMFSADPLVETAEAAADVSIVFQQSSRCALQIAD